ncbi:apolipoprotein N-acyltransferase [Hydrogenophaga sp.]|uniref:apolipoprotein N-acyltransferase n=1 Tax=Hydrogenophaga sp. TaxID=1904254 RepID=UPI003F6A552F
MRSLFGSLHNPSSFEPMSRLPPGRRARSGGAMWALLCLLAGGLQAASLAWPFQDWSLPGTATGQPSGWLQMVSLAVLVLALQHSGRLGSAAWRGWLFATAWLVGTFWWLFVSMHTYGGLSAWLAALAVLALAGALALYYAAAAAVLYRWAPVSRSAQALLFAALWTLAELARGRWLTGFPWGAGGYAQVDQMAAWAPLVGVYGMGFLAAVLAYALASVVSGASAALGDWLLTPTRRAVHRAGVAPLVGARTALRWGNVWRAAPTAVLLLALLWSVLGDSSAWRAFGQRDTTSAGMLRVWLLQGNVAQDEKFEAGTGVAQALAWYPQQIAEAVAAAKAGLVNAPQLVVAPETALPLLPLQLGPAFWRPLLDGLAQPGVASPVQVLLGLPLGSFSQGYTNSAWGVSPASAAAARDQLALSTDPQAPVSLASEGFYRYDKHHLVPFGEFIPPLFRWFIDLMHIPLGDFSRGTLAQAPWPVDGQRLAPNICYEDLFGEELAATFRDPAQAPTVLVNLSNIAWFGDTVAIDQHLHISRLRALELGRPMLRATNTGATAVIDHRGVVTHQLPRLTRDRLEAAVQGRSGTTLYARWTAHWGLWPLWGMCLAVVLVLAIARCQRMRLLRS